MFQIAIFNLITVGIFSLDQYIRDDKKDYIKL